MDKTIRQQIFERMKAGLGVPEVAKVRAGELYRWSLVRPDDLTLYVTMDSPERDDFAHVMLSDGTKYQANAIESLMLYTTEEADMLVARILRQWKANPRKDKPLVSEAAARRS
jgi:hypothetical protein